MNTPPPASTPAPVAHAVCVELRDVAVPALRNPAKLTLENVNWSVAVGDYWAVGGLVSSGKTDLLSVAAGLQRPALGTCRFFGQEFVPDFEDEHLSVRRRVGFVFDGGQLLHDLTLEENVALPLRYHGDAANRNPAARLKDLIYITGLEAWAGSYPAHVNRNWQQRFGLARALARNPELLLLDNPLSGLDPSDAAWWLETLAALAAGHPILNNRPLTLVVSGNDLRPWRQSARQFALLQERQFIVLGDRPALDTQSQPALTDLLRPWHN